MAVSTTRLIPAQKYTFIDVAFNPAGQQCQNCKKLIHYVGEVWGRTNNEHYFIGMDCAKTVTEQSDFRYHDRQFGAVRKALKALSNYAAEPQYALKHPIKCTWSDSWKCVLLVIPQVAIRDFSDMIGPKDWPKLYQQVQEKLTSLGIALPEVPA